MGKKTRPLSLTEEQRDRLETWVRAKTTPQRVAFRAQICLLSADGLSDTEIANRMNTSRPTVLVWKRRCEEEGPDSLAKDAPRGPSTRRLDDATRQAIVEATLNTLPADGRQWTTRTLADVVGVSNATVARIWNELGIGPKKRKTRKRSRERGVQPRLFDLAGVYMNPPVKAVAIWVGSLLPVELSRHTHLDISSRPRQANCSRPGDVNGCGSCLSAALCLLDSMSQGCGYSDVQQNVNELLDFLNRLGGGTTEHSELHIFLEQVEDEIHLALNQWARDLPFTRVHTIAAGSFAQSIIQETMTGITGAQLAPTSSRSVPCLVASIDDFVRLGATEEPFLWIKQPSPAGEDASVCKAILETMRFVGTLIGRFARHYSIHPQFIRMYEEEPMNWRQKLESWFAATAFAEEGEHETALKIAATPIPEEREATGVIPSLSTAFAAIAFAEENCHEYASEIMFGVRSRNSFLEAVGLSHVRVWRGTAEVEESFAQAVGLAGARFRLLTVQL
jgi:transposase